MVWKRLLQNEAVEECPSVSTFDPLYIFLISIAAVFILVFAITSLILLAPKRRQKTKELHDELLTHALITGGSSGIGLSVGKELVTRKCKFVTLVARNVEKLENAKKELEQYATSIASPTVIGILSVDVSDAEKISAAAAKLSSPDSGFPIVTMLFNVAGTSTSAHIVDTDYKEYERLMSINYLGSAYTTRAFLPYMKMTSKDKKSTNPPRAIMLTCSQAGQVGVFGFTAYSASKFALRGFAEALHMEIAKDNISVQVVYPPDTDTPGFELENIDKPEETRLISEVAGLLQPESVAKKMVSSALMKRPPFSVHFGLDGWMLSTISAGMSPTDTILNALCQIFLMGLLRFISLFYLMDFRRIINKVQRRKQDEDKKTK